MPYLLMTKETCYNKLITIINDLEESMYKETAIADICSFEDSFSKYTANYIDYFKHPDKYCLAPFRIFGNLYYVGDQKACPYLIDTGEGLILIDTGEGTNFRICWKISAS